MMNTALQLTQCTVLTPALAEHLSNFNQLQRDLREAGIKVVGVEIEANRLTIDAASTGILTSNFMPEIRGLVMVTNNGTSRISTRMRGVEVCWLRPVQEF